eukprot:GHVQ01028663.1.p1 GENE.GHVQ01028663.1~~GHVQ01028663.1.p1  ORF type:complete len:598 (-),score=60.74 GHVQ01028663.1:199-1992(-)
MPNFSPLVSKHAHAATAVFVLSVVVVLSFLLYRSGYSSFLHNVLQSPASSSSSSFGFDSNNKASVNDPFSTSLTLPLTPPVPGHASFVTSLNSTDACGYSSSGSWQEAFIQVQEEILSGKRPPKAIIWACDTGAYGGLCGGMGDRFRGLVTGMYLAAVSGRAFFIHQNIPARIEYAFLPNSIAWNTEPVTDEICTRGHGKPGCFKGNAKTEPGAPPESQFEKVFFKWNGPDSPVSNVSINNVDIDTHGARPWPTAFLKQLPWSEDVFILRSNRITAMYRKRFLEDLLLYVDSSSHELPWKDLVDDPLIRQLRDGLRKIPVGYGLGCAMRFLFVVSPGVVSEANKMVLGLFSANSTSTSPDSFMQTAADKGKLFDAVFPERSFYYRPTNTSVTGRGLNRSLTDHLSLLGNGLISSHVVPKAKKVIGVHVRLVRDDTGNMFADNGGARCTNKDLYGVMECAKALADKRKWFHDEVVYVLFSDSPDFRKEALANYQGTVLVDPYASISHVERYFPDQQEEELRKYESTVAEMMVLSVCDAVTLTYSGFGELAQSWGLISEEATARYWRDVNHGYEGLRPMTCYLPGEKKIVCTIFSPCWD